MSRQFDAIVIGSGLGGLTAAALYARSGRKVLVLERNDAPGGAAMVYQHGTLSIEASLHEIDGLDPDDPKMPLFQSLGLDKSLEFIDLKDLYEVRGQALGAPFVLPHGFDAALAAATARFPHQKKALHTYFERLVLVRTAISFASRSREENGFWWLRRAPEAVRKLWPLLREGDATAGEVLDSLFGDDEAVKLMLCANLGYYHNDPYRMLYVSFAIAQGSYLLGGGHYLRGGSKALVEALLTAISQAGGKVELRREAAHILFEGERISGVAHRGRDPSSEEFDYAPIIFGNAAPLRLCEMLPQERRANFLEPYRDREPSISLWSLSIGLNRRARDFGVEHYSTFVLPDWLQSLRQFEEKANRIKQIENNNLPPYVLVDYSSLDTSLNENGPYLCSVTGVDRVENWASLNADEKAARKNLWMELIIADLDKMFPGFSKAIETKELATAETMQHYLNTPGGAVYGFAPEGTLLDLLRRKPETSVIGLFLASTYCMGGGYSGAMLGGALAANAAMKWQSVMV